MNLLLLRGLIRDQRCWGDFPSRLAAHAPHLKLHYLDLPGVGTENARECPDSITAIRIDVAKRFHERVAQGKFPKGPWSLMAISMGGMVAIDWVAAEPDLFQNFVVINTSAADVARVFERFRFRHLPEMIYALATGEPERSERLILKIVSNRFQEMDSLLSEQIRWRKERPVSRKTFVRQILSAARFRLPNSRLKPRTVLISSEGDRLVSPLCSARLAERLGVPRISHPWSGHDIPVDDPEWLAQRLREILPDPNAPRVGFRA
jgi:pimeloyl-ACP methyl ester carboxylesterase